MGVRPGRLVSEQSIALIAPQLTLLVVSTCIVSILRLQSLYVISRAVDVTWENPLAAIWSSVEVNTGILCSCLPTLKACLTRVSPHIFSNTSAHSSENTPTSTANDEQRIRGVSFKRRSKLSFDALGRGLTGKSEPTQSSTISGNTDTSSGGDIEMKDFGTQRGCSHEWDRHIQVVTTVEQDVEKIGGSRPQSRVVSA